MSLSQQKLGFHYYPDTDHYADSDLQTWLPVLKSAGASWLTLRARASQTIPEQFVRSIVEAGIQPVVHVVEPMTSIRMAQVYTALNNYSEWGVRHVAFYDRPNLRSSWPATAWTHADLVERFVDVILPILHAQQEMGCTPLLPPLEPGGDYWDTAFLQHALALLKERGQTELIDTLTLSIYMWSFGHQLDWGQGGNAAWPKTRPYSTPDGSQDQRGFQIDTWYQEIAQAVLGRSLTTLVIAGGAGPSHIYPSAEAIQAGNNEVARHLAQSGLQDTILNFSFYPLATSEGHVDAGAAWYLTPEGSRSDDPMLHSAASTTASSGCEHYILLGLTKQVNGLQLWNAIAPLVMTARPTVGFSVDEACQAVRVSLIGDLSAFPPSTLDQLRAAGANVDHYPDIDSDAILLAASSAAATTGVSS